MVVAPSGEKELI